MKGASVFTTVSEGLAVIVLYCDRRKIMNEDQRKKKSPYVNFSKSIPRAPQRFLESLYCKYGMSHLPFGT